MMKAIRLIALGKRQAQIAREMGISVHTVRSYIYQAYERLGVHNAAAAAAELTKLTREGTESTEGNAP
jgi:DNA-binding CsgD family transcriptional regulator